MDDSGLTNLPAVANNLTDLASALSDVNYGWLTAQAQNIILDPQNAHDLGIGITRLTKQAEDLLLIYYAGHGLVDPRGNLHLALTGTQRDYLRYTAFPFDGLRDAISDSPAKNRVLILDCCYSGRAIDTMSNPEDAVYEQLDIAGTYTLTSTTATSMSLAPHGARHTTFTGELIKLLRNGSSDAPDPLTLDHIYRQLRRVMTRSGHPRPQQRGTDTTPHLALARNRAVYRQPSTSGGLAHRYGSSNSRTGVDIVGQLTQNQLALMVESRIRFDAVFDLEGAARELAEMMAPGFADSATVALLTSVLRGYEPAPLFADQLAQLTLAAASGVERFSISASDSVREIVEHASTGSYAQGLRSGRSIVIPNLNEEDIRRISTSPDRAERNLKAGFHSYLMVPLVSRGRVFGGVEFFRTSATEPFRQADVLLAEEVVALAASCMESIHHPYKMRALSLELQQHLLPRMIHVPSGLGIAHRYVPASESNGIGGDWFDVVALADHRVALIVGDVSGRGISASAAMGQIRAVARALLVLEMEPEHVLAQLDQAVTDIGQGRGDLLMTCVCVICDPISRRCVASNAGHPLPMVAATDGIVRTVELPAGLPLGFGDRKYVSETFVMPENGILTLYTDGLLSTLKRSYADGVDILTRALSRRGSDLEDACDLVAEALITSERPDDVVILMAQVDAPVDRVQVEVSYIQ